MPVRSESFVVDVAGSLWTGAHDVSDGTEGVVAPISLPLLKEGGDICTELDEDLGRILRDADMLLQESPSLSRISLIDRCVSLDWLMLVLPES